MKCAINEIFGPTIQGEGLFSGVPSIFVRFNGCNLRCCFKGGSICDTAYTSHTPEQSVIGTTGEALNMIKKLLNANLQVSDIVFTGGEPMLQQEALVEIIDELDKCYDNLCYTVETNGTLPVKDIIKGKIDLWSISPKLNNSAYFEGHNISKTLQVAHNSFRVNYKAICTYLEEPGVQLKFVYTDEETEQEIKDWLDGLYRVKSIVTAPVLIMPEGATAQQITQASEKAVQACIRNGWRFCDRVHIRIWGNKRGV